MVVELVEGPESGPLAASKARTGISQRRKLELSKEIFVWP